MNRLYVKLTVNPAFKRRQLLPLLAAALQTKGNGRPGLPAPDLNPQTAPATHEPARGGSVSLCKNFAFSNLF